MPMYGGGDAAWPHGQMIDMAKSPEKIREDAAPIADSARPAVPQYPYGLCISLDDESLAKLGLDGELPQAGDILEFCAAAKVTCASTTENVDPMTGQTKACKRVELQIVAIAPHEEESAVEEAMERSAARRKRFYGDTMQSYDRDVAAYNGSREAGPRP